MKKIILTLILAFILIPHTSFSADTYKLIEPLPCIDGVGNCKAGDMQKEININDYILYVYKFSIGISVFLAIIMIIWGGFLTITSEVPYIKSDGKDKITNAAVGLAMVLVSYLILATIDPRLVNINTTIEPIKVDSLDLKSVKDFKSTLSNDLRTMSVENQIKVQEIDSKIKDLQKEKDAVDAKILYGDAIYEGNSEEMELKSKNLQQQINTELVNKNIVLAESNGAINFSTVLSNTGNEDIVSKYTAKPIANTTGTTPRPTNSPNVIQNQYNQKINDILNLSNSSGDQIQKLEKQRDFYIAQAQEEVEFQRFIESQKNGTVNTAPAIPTMGAYQGGYTNTNLDINYLEKKLVQYKADIVDLNKQANSGLQLTDYSRILQARINTIEQATGKNGK